MPISPLLLALVSQERFSGGETDSCARNSHLDLSSSGAHQFAELLAHALQETQSVVVGEGGQKVLDCDVLVRASGVLLQLGHDLGLVLGTESWGTKDGRQLGIFVVYVVQGADSLCDDVERGSLHGCSVLFLLRVSHVLAATTSKKGLDNHPGRITRRYERTRAVA